VCAFRVLWVASLLLTLGGCYATDKRYGPDPIIAADSVESASRNEIRILNALAQDAGIPSVAQDYWYEVTRAGFNYVDDQCRLYFNQLFFIDREKDQIKSAISAAASTTAAVMGVTGATAKSIAVVAQAFGLAGISTDLAAGTYLYQLPPATAQAFVRQLQLAYREGAAQRRLLINGPNAAYHAIQGYLSLCLPPTIEAKIAENIATARAVPEPVIPGAGASFDISVASAPPLTRDQLRATLITRVRNPVPVFERRPAITDGHRISDFEKRSMSDSDIRDVQKALCVNPDGDLGPLETSKTREKLSIFLASQHVTPTDRVTPRAWVFLKRLIRGGKTSPDPCPPASK